MEYRKLKYNKIIIKNSYFISFLVGVSGPWLKNTHELNSKSLQPFKTHNELEIGTISARTRSENKFHSVSSDSLDLMSVKSGLNISRLN